MSIGVLLVDDQALIRGGLAMVIESQDDMRVVGEAGDGAAVVGHLRRTPADVVLMDIRMPRVDGITATRQVREEFGERAPKVLILTTFDTDEHLHAALRAGAAGFVLKGARCRGRRRGDRAVRDQTPAGAVRAHTVGGRKARRQSAGDVD